MIHRPDPRCPLVGDEFIYHGTNGSHRYTVVDLDFDCVWVRRNEDDDDTVWCWKREWIFPDVGVQREVDK